MKLSLARIFGQRADELGEPWASTAQRAGTPVDERGSTNDVSRGA
jgi:hypothetical protein